MSRIISAAPLCTPHTPVLDFLDAAVKGGFDHVGIRLKEPQPGTRLHSIMETRQSRNTLVRRVKDLGLKVLEVEAFWINPDFDFDSFKICVDVAFELQPKFLLVVGNDPDAGRMRDNFCRTEELGKSAGMRTVVEFIPYTALSTMHEAQALIEASGTNAGHLIDTLHVSRSGGTSSEVAALPGSNVCMFHICDASAKVPATVDEKRAEARGNRLPPGEGALPLREIINAAAADTPVEVECPVKAFNSLDPLEIMTRLRKSTLDCLGE